MKKIVIILVLVIAGWFVYTKCAPVEQKKSYEQGKEFGDSLNSSVDKAEKAAAVANLTILKSAIMQFHSQEKRYPYALDELQAKGFISSVKASFYSYDSATGEISAK